MIRKSRWAMGTALLLCAAIAFGDDRARHADQLRIDVVGDLEGIVLTDPLGRSDRDSAGYVMGNIPDCIREGDTREDNDDDSVGSSAWPPTSMAFTIPSPTPGLFRLVGRATKKSAIQITATVISEDERAFSSVWGTTMSGTLRCEIALACTDSCTVNVSRQRLVRKPRR